MEDPRLLGKTYDAIYDGIHGEEQQQELRKLLMERYDEIKSNQ